MHWKKLTFSQLLRTLNKYTKNQIRLNDEPKHGERRSTNDINQHRLTDVNSKSVKMEEN